MKKLPTTHNIPKNVNNKQLPQIPVPMEDRPIFGGEDALDYNYRIVQRNDKDRQNNVPTGTPQP